MKLPRIPRRCAFTLIELLVVIAIIAVLASLLLAGVFKALATAKMVQNRNDITQLEAAVANFKTITRAPYLPSNTNPDILTFGNILYPQAPPGWIPNLQGNAALVFFLAGYNGQGFSSDPTQPTLPAQPGEQRVGPFYEFPANRLNPPGPPIPGSMFLDVYGTPFAYFSTTGTPNSYNLGDNIAIGCAGAYQDSSGNFVNPSTFQIISAGPPTPGYGPTPLFNPGNIWPGVPPGPGFDDLSNFATRPLGIGQ